jgi:hypothetical protein
MAFGGRATVFLAVDARVVDDRVHSADRINLFRDILCFAAVAEIANDQSGGTWREVGDRDSTVW